MQGCFYATGPSVYGPFTMQGAVIDTAKIAPDFQCDGQPHQCGAALDAPITAAATAPQRARAEALALYALQPTVRAGPPRVGDTIMLMPCAATPAAATGWTQKRGTAKWGPGTAFQIALSSNPGLCIEAQAGGIGARLTLQSCNNSALQMFLRNTTASSGDDVTGREGGCPCWNVQVDNGANPAPKSAGEFVQCFSCVDGDQFNKNQRFTFPADGGSGQIRAWNGWAPGYCVAAVVPAPPAPPAPKPWYLKEDYTDRHGSFLQHGNQWYYASNDRSHSGDDGHEGVFRGTVLCYIHFRANGTMEPCVVNAQGVSQHGLSPGHAIEAEEFFSMDGDGAVKVDLQHALQVRGEGFAVGGRGGALLRYPHVTGLVAAYAGGRGDLTLRVATSGPGATIEIRANATGAAAGAGVAVSDASRSGSGPRGLLLASCPLPATGGLARFADVPCTFAALKAPAAAALEWEAELAVRFEGPAGVRLDRFWA